MASAVCNSKLRRPCYFAGVPPPPPPQKTMRFSRWSSAIAFLSLALRVAADSESAVMSLTAADFDEKVNPENLILVEFFAPW